VRFFTRLLTGHGCFNWCLNRIGRAPASGCSLCGPPDSYSEEVNDAFHTLIRCEAFKRARDELGLVIGSFRPCDLVAPMLESPGNLGRWGLLRGGHDAVQGGSRAREAVPAGDTSIAVRETGGGSSRSPLSSVRGGGNGA